MILKMQLKTLRIIVSENSSRTSHLFTSFRFNSSNMHEFTAFLIDFDSKYIEARNREAIKKDI